MAEEPENLTIRLLQELHRDMQEMRADLVNRVDGNTLLLNMVAGFVHDHEHRIDRLEQTKN